MGVFSEAVREGLTAILLAVVYCGGGLLVQEWIFWKHDQNKKKRGRKNGRSVKQGGRSA